MLLTKKIRETISKANSKSFLETIFYSQNAEFIIKDIEKSMSLIEFINIVELMYLEDKLWIKRSANEVYSKIKKVMKLYEPPLYTPIDTINPIVQSNEPAYEETRLPSELFLAQHLTPEERSFCLSVAMGIDEDTSLRYIYNNDIGLSLLGETPPEHEFTEYKIRFKAILEYKFKKLNLTDNI